MRSLLLFLLVTPLCLGAQDTLTHERQWVINFPYGGIEIPPPNFPTLDSVANYLLQQDSFVLRIEGHTDTVGTATSNERYSLKRALSVNIALEKRNIPVNRMYMVAYGFKKPVASNKTEAGKAKNRRAEIKATCFDFIPPPPPPVIEKSVPAPPPPPPPPLFLTSEDNEFSIPCGKRRVVVKAMNGTEIRFPGSCFANCSGEVKLVVSEFFTPDQWVRNELSTFGESQLFYASESGVCFHATLPSGEPASLQPGTALEVLIPSRQMEGLLVHEEGYADTRAKRRKFDWTLITNDPLSYVDTAQAYLMQMDTASVCLAYQKPLRQVLLFKPKGPMPEQAYFYTVSGDELVSASLPYNGTDKKYAGYYLLGVENLDGALTIKSKSFKKGKKNYQVSMTLAPGKLKTEKVKIDENEYLLLGKPKLKFKPVKDAKKVKEKPLKEKK
jgi:hypothetical protein